MSLLDELLADLRAECAALDLIARRVPPGDWATRTPADGWDIRDQIWHLAWYDGAAYRATAEPQAYAAEWTTVFTDVDAYASDVVRKGRELAPEAVLAQWREQAGLFQRAALAGGPRTRVAWHDTQMSVASMVTARIQETWAHGQDIRDALGLPPEVSDRLRHVAHLGCWRAAVRVPRPRRTAAGRTGAGRTQPALGGGVPVRPGRRRRPGDRPRPGLLPGRHPAQAPERRPP